MQHPARFALEVACAFDANQGLLLAGAVAYYALLSIVPLLLLIVIALSHLLERGRLMAALGVALEWVAPGHSQAVLVELTEFLDAHVALGWMLLGTMLVFSSLAFRALENAMSVIFRHRHVEHRRRFLVSLAIRLAYILFLGFVLLVGTLVQAGLASIGKESLVVLGQSWPLGRLSGVLLYVAGVVMEIGLIASVYLVMPSGRPKLLHALIGAAAAGILWEVVRHGFIWYSTHFSHVSVLYGSLSGAIVVLLGFELGATLLLLGAQVIAEYEQPGKK
ncbi:MAG TPA: YhjD/YihY/BrkB family envelope integrity protein [Burkholderiales bacterium]|nr:YhjD/YihY/BrkB family envelope integrity protein [Burkholderiales bacterium]